MTELRTIEDALLRIEWLMDQLRLLDTQIAVTGRAVRLTQDMRHRLSNEMQILLLWVQRYEKLHAQVIPSADPSDLEAEESQAFVVLPVVAEPQDPQK